MTKHNASLSVTHAGEATTVDTGAMRFVLDTRKVAIRSLAVGDKTLVSENEASILFATAMESAVHDGVRDFVPRRMIEARHECREAKTSAENGVFTAELEGILAFSAADAIAYSLRLRAVQGETRLALGAKLEPRGDFHDLFIRAVGLHQPLALNSRKRVVQAGDQGMRWDTRYRYEYTVHNAGTFGRRPRGPRGDELPRDIPPCIAHHPEHNYWRHFYIDQDSDHSYSLWRAESRGVSGLCAFRGRRAPGWMTLYDEEGGALLGYRGFSERAPKCLYAYAEDGGQGVVYLYSPTQPAFDINDPRLSSAVFGEAHEIDWVFFEGEEAVRQPERELAATWDVETLSSDGPPRLEPLAVETDLWSAASATDNDVPLVAGGVPLPRAAIVRPDQARLFLRGRETPAQFQPLAYWPDRSIKWLLLIFPLDGDGGYRFTPGSGEGDEASFEVTLRKGEPVPATLRFGGDVRAGAPETSLQAVEDAHGVTLSTGPLTLALTSGERWLASALLRGREMLRPVDAPQAFVDFLRTDAVYPVGETHPEGNDDPGPVQIRRIEVEEAGPLRAVVRLEGRAMAEESAPVVLRVEAYAGRSYVRLFHSVVFEQTDPRRAFVRRVGLRFPLALQPGGLHCGAGVQDGTRSFPLSGTAGLRQTSHLNYELWHQESGERLRDVLDSEHCSRGWLSVGDGEAGMAVVVRDMWQEFPKELVVRAEGPDLEVGLWPESSPLMDVRRYSNYPHVAQWEVATWEPDCVLDSYYPDPFLRNKMRGRKKFIPWRDWRFRADPDDRGREENWPLDNDDRNWRGMHVPGFWQHTDVGGYRGVAWYRTVFNAPKELAGRELELVFEGVYEEAWVYLNGALVGERTLESTGLEVDSLYDRPFAVAIPSDKLRPGEENVLTIRVKAVGFMGGISRPVYFAVPQDAAVESPAPEDDSAKQGPFVGVSKSHELLLAFHSRDMTPERLDTIAADFQSRPLVYAGWDWYAKTRITMPLAHPRNPKFRRAYRNLINVADWWLFHQKAYGWYGLWDYGDVRHRYRAGSGRIVAPDSLAKFLSLPAAERGRFVPDVSDMPRDYFPQNDWAFENGRWGWGNTEGLVNVPMSLMYLFTGRRDIFFFVEADARHVRDVDARHSGVWFGLGTRHGVQHWSDGNHEERQTVFTEQRFHYFLTGEHRTREWNRELSDRFYLTGACGRHTAHSGRTFGLLFRWEITGDPELGEILQRYMRAIARPEGLAVDTIVKFPEAVILGEPRSLHGASMFFHCFGGLHAVLEYYYLTGDERVRDSILATAEHVYDRPGTNDPYAGPTEDKSDPSSVNFTVRKVLAFAARHAPDGEKFRRVLTEWAAGDGFRYVFQQVPAKPDHWFGETSFFRGNVTAGLFWFGGAPYVLGALDSEPPLSEAQEAELAANENRPVVSPPRAPRESWQSEYDRPEFRAYFRDPMLDRLPK